MKSASLVILFVCSCTITIAQVPGTLSYQGILMQSDGITPITDGAHSIVFNFYTVSTGGSALFSRTISVTTAKGLYTCIIGGGTAPNAPFNATEMNQIGSQQIYIGINVDAGGELSPRAQLTTGPYSLRAQSVTNTANPAGGNVAFWGTNNTLSSDAGLFWDNTNKRLGVGTVTPLHKFHINQTLTGTDITTPVLARFSNSTLNGHSKIILGTDNATGDGFSTFTAGATAASQILGFGVGNASSTTTQLNLTGSGNVGIGTTSPQSSLEIAGGNIDISNNQRIGYLNSDFFTYDAKGVGSYSLGWYSDSWDAFGNSAWLSGYSGIKLFTASTPRLSITYGGNVGIGTTTPGGYRVYISGTGFISGGAWSTSDVRYKKDFIQLEGSLEKILQLEGVSFKWRNSEFPEMNLPDGRHYGFKAQEVERFFPDLISTDENGYKGMNYSGMNAVLLEAIKEQQTQIESLKTELTEIKKLLNLSTESKLNAGGKK